MRKLIRAKNRVYDYFWLLLWWSGIPLCIEMKTLSWVSYVSHLQGNMYKCTDFHFSYMMFDSFSSYLVFRKLGKITFIFCCAWKKNFIYSFLRFDILRISREIVGQRTVIYRDYISINLYYEVTKVSQIKKEFRTTDKNT